MLMVLAHILPVTCFFQCWRCLAPWICLRGHKTKKLIPGAASAHGNGNILVNEAQLPLSSGIALRWPSVSRGSLWDWYVTHSCHMSFNVLFDWLLPHPYSYSHPYNCFLRPPPKYNTGSESQSGALLEGGQPEAPTSPPLTLQHDVLLDVSRAILITTAAPQPSNIWPLKPCWSFCFISDLLAFHSKQWHSCLWGAFMASKLEVLEPLTLSQRPSSAHPGLPFTSTSDKCPGSTSSHIYKRP